MEVGGGGLLAMENTKKSSRLSETTVDWLLVQSMSRLCTGELGGMVDRGFSWPPVDDWPVS